MARSIKYSDFAKLQIRELPRDKILLKALFRHFENAADYPERYTEPGVYPVSPHRRMPNAELTDQAGESWHFAIVFGVTDEVLEVRVVRYAQYDLPPGIERD